MFQYQCLNPISKVGLDGFTNDYTKTEEIKKDLKKSKNFKSPRCS